MATKEFNSAIAAGASVVPGSVTDELFAPVQAHWDDGQTVAIMAVVAMYGFLNRWNDTMSTQLEQPFRQAAEAALGHAGWTPGRHA